LATIGNAPLVRHWPRDPPAYCIRWLPFGNPKLADKCSEAATPRRAALPGSEEERDRRTVPPKRIILHSRADVVPSADSEELLRNTSLPTKGSVEVGGDRRWADRNDG